MDLLHLWSTMGMFAKTIVFIMAGMSVYSLTIVLTEVDCGWLPYFAEQADDKLRMLAMNVTDQDSIHAAAAELERDARRLCFAHRRSRCR